MKRRHIVVTAFVLLTVACSVAEARQGPAPPAPPADLPQRIRAAQDQAFKQDYGFTDKQIADYRKKDAAIKASYEKKIETLRSQVAKSKPARKRELYTQIRAMEKQMDKDRNAALLAIANPAQKQKIRAQYAKNGIPL